MFALSFDMVVADLKTHYGEPYNNAYYEIRQVLEAKGFEWIQGSTYMTKTDDLGKLFEAIQSLSKIDWFKKSVRDVRGYKVDNWSDFTNLVRNS